MKWIYCRKSRAPNGRSLITRTDATILLEIGPTMELSETHAIFYDLRGLNASDCSRVVQRKSRDLLSKRRDAMSSSPIKRFQKHSPPLDRFN